MDERIHLFLIPIIVLAALPLHAAHSTNSRDEDMHSKQRRLFNNYNDWQLSGEDDTFDGDTVYDKAENRNNAGLKFLEEIMESRQRDDFDENSYSLHYDADRELESSLPYGIQNVMDARTSARTLRSKNKRSQKLITFQSLCPSERETVSLTMDPDYEYRPDFYEEVLCAVRTVHNPNSMPAAVCSQAGFSCIQLNRTLHLTRRPRDQDCWETKTRVVAAGCECMWPKHSLGNILAHH